jgi:octaprenyl-diphosphate synthase
MDQLLGPIQKEMDLFERRLDEMLQSDVEMVHQVARYMASLKGKRLRPALVVLSAKATGLWNDSVIDAGVGVEMIHAATMVHDDVVDGAATRRGKASVNAKWDDHIAVLMGDFLLARALSILVSLGNQRALAVVSHATERLSQGEMFEFQIGLQGDTREESYFGMVGDKTASLISASCKIGPLLAGAPDPVVDALGAYGECLGLAFQVADDVLDFTGDAGTLGKPVGRDLREGKITLPLIHALAAAPEEKRHRIEVLLRREENREEDWRDIINFVEEHHGVRSASETARRYAARAEESLRILEPSVARSILETAVHLVVDRDN